MPLLQLRAVELWGLQEGVAFARELGEVLVEVPEEADEHARQHPCDGDLRDLLIAPGVEGFRRALARPRCGASRMAAT